MISFTPPSEAYGAYLFDCDGTLADTMPLHYDAWKRAVQAHGADFDYSVKLFYSMAGVSVVDTIDRLNKQFSASLDPDAVGETKKGMYAAMLSDVTPIQPVVDFCLKLLEQGEKVAVVSGSTREEVNATLGAIGLSGKFTTMVCQGESARGKPQPDPFTKAADILGVAYANCYVLEDSPHSLEGAKGVGMSGVLIPNAML